MPMDLLVVGAGEMGRWFAEEMAPVFDRVDFFDIDSDVAIEAAATVDTGWVDHDDRAYDVVCIAVPMSVATESIREQAPRAKRAMVDITGSMGDPIDAMRTYLPNQERLSLHPLFSATNAPGSIAVVSDKSGPISEIILERLSHLGNTLVPTTADEHDKAMETVQAKVHTSILAFALAADAVPEGLETPIYRELDELARSVTVGTPQVYAEIQDRFNGATSVANAAKALADADRETFVRLYKDAGDR